MYLCKACNIYSVDLEKLKTHCSEEHGTPPDDTESAIVCIQPLDPMPVAEKRKRGRPRKYPKVVGSPPVDGREQAEGREKAKAEGAQRKRGRPRKNAEEKERDRKQLLKRLEEEAEGQRSPQGHKCETCGKVFTRHRQLSSHRCRDDPHDTNTAQNEVEEEEESESASFNGTVESGSLQFDLESIPDGLDLAELGIPQILSDRGRPTGNSATHPCQICKKVLSSKSSLATHLRTHSSRKRFECAQCSYSTSYKANLAVHMKRHFPEQRLQCDLCSFSCLGKRRLKAHQRRHGAAVPARCDLCGDCHPTADDLLRHLAAKHDVDGDEMARRCYQRATSPRPMRRGYHRCRVCDRRFGDKEERDAHTALHKPHKPLRCPLCPYAAYRYTSLETHAKRHWFIYACHLCGANVLSLDQLQSHLASHEMPAGTSAADFLEKSLSVSMYQYDPIDKELIGELKRKSQEALPHRATAESEGIVGDHQDATIYDSASLDILNTPLVDKSELRSLGEIFAELSFKRLSARLLEAIRALFGANECPVCGKLFLLRPHLDTHKRTHHEEKEFKCEACSYSSHTKGGLQRHRASAHTQANLQCPLCPFEARNSAALASHQQECHGAQTYTCSRCDLSTASEAEMKRHLVASHPELAAAELAGIMGRPIHARSKVGRIVSHRCQHCGQDFRRLCDLRQHLWLHTGTAPYKCALCPFATRNASNLKSHMVRHSDAKRHLCDICGKLFKMKNSLKVHRLAQHPDDNHQHSCADCGFKAASRSQLKRHLEVHAKPSARTFRCFQCTEFTSDKQSLRDHYLQEHPDAVFDETLAYEVAEDRITTLNISINQRDGFLHYRCSQCDVTLLDNGELGQHLRESHGLAITTTTSASSGNEGDAVVGDLQPSAADQTDLASLQQGLDVSMHDADHDERVSAMQILQNIIDIQAASGDTETSGVDPTLSLQHYDVKDQVEEPVVVSGASTDLHCLAVSDSLHTMHADMQQTVQSLPTAETDHYHTSQHNSYGSSEVIPDAVLEQEVVEVVAMQTEGHMAYAPPPTS